MRIAAIVWCTRSGASGLSVPAHSGRPEQEPHGRPQGLPRDAGRLGRAGWCTIVEDEIRFWNGSKIYLCHCKDEKDIYKYQGAEIHVLLIDELTHFTETMYRFLRNRVRMVGIVIPKEYAGRFPRILCGANPGNIGHLWVKSTFVTSGPADGTAADARRRWRHAAAVHPGALEDNPSMTDDDPGYEMRLEGLGSAALVQAMRWGDWDVVEGAFFDCWDTARHVVRPFEIPRIGRVPVWGLGLGQAVLVWLVGCCRRQIQDGGRVYGCRGAAWSATANGTGCSRQAECRPEDEC
jgi:hypothetical protein